MAFVSKLFFLLFIIPTMAFSQELVEVATKQSEKNLRYVSNNGKHTFFQSMTGSLHYSTNYSSTEILKHKKGTQYLVSAAPSNELFIIDENKNYYTNISYRSNHSIYLFKPNEKKPSLLGEGNDPKFHLMGKYISFYDFNTKAIHIKNIDGLQGNYSINLINTVNPYFAPQIVMLDKDNIIYTDINKKGIQGIIHFNRETKKSEPILKSSTQLQKIEICVNSKNIFIGLFGLSGSAVGSSITYTDYKTHDFTNRKELYSSKYNDIGNIKCSIGKKLYFIKRYNNNNEKIKTEVALLSIPEGKVEALSNVGTASQIIEMGGKVLMPHMGKLYLITGENNLAEDNLEAKNKMKSGKK